MKKVLLYLEENVPGLEMAKQYRTENKDPLTQPYPGALCGLDSVDSCEGLVSIGGLNELYLENVGEALNRVEVGSQDAWEFSHVD